jgi:hypothetical protein
MSLMTHLAKLQVSATKEDAHLCWMPASAPLASGSFVIRTPNLPPTHTANPPFTQRLFASIKLPTWRTIVPSMFLISTVLTQPASVRLKSRDFLSKFMLPIPSVLTAHSVTSLFPVTNSAVVILLFAAIPA